MKKRIVELTVNGEKREVLSDDNTLLVNMIRNDLHLTGTKYTCGTGQCGACTVLADGEPILSCITLAADMEGKEITTIEGVAEPDGTLDPLQEAFLDNGAVQCGFCTPGMVLVGKHILEKAPNASEEEIRHQLEGNLCRCTGYNGIVRAIKSCSHGNCREE